MTRLLSKTEYIMYRECFQNTWVRRHRPDIHSSYELSEFEESLKEMGNEVEEVARNLFPGGYLVHRRSEGAQELTQKLIADRTPVIFQAVFATDKYLAATDVMQWNPEAEAYDLFEIKMSSTDEEEDENGNMRVNKKKEEQFERDLSFQANVIEACGVKLNKKCLIRLNRQYVRDGDLDYSRLFNIDDKTSIITAIQPIAALEMERAYTDLTNEASPVGNCTCYYKGRSAHCTTFKFNNPSVPDYSVHDLNRIGNSKVYLRQLLDAGVLEIGQVPVDAQLAKSIKKYNQVQVHKAQEPIIDVEAIREELGKLEYPLYFLDYETFPTPIPPYSGYRPYQHIVFQYSLHVVHAPDAEPQHFGDLILGGDPAEKIAEQLKAHIGPKGTVISWFKTFENSRNRELARLLPQYAEFFESLVARTYDLMDIVEKQHYVHPGFHGKASIKKVLPVLVPSLSYKGLAVKNGTDAIAGYRALWQGEITGEDAEQKKRDMLEYCKLDTLAMYEIWRRFREVANSLS